jgi:hypothetical protein
VNSRAIVVFFPSNAHRFKLLRVASAGETTKQAIPRKLEFGPSPRPWGDSFVPKSKPPAQRVLALNVAACENLILAMPQLAQKLKLPVEIDLRGTFSNYANGLNKGFGSAYISDVLEEASNPTKVNC